MDGYGQDRRGPEDVFQVTRPIFEAKGWLRFMGIVYIIQGILCCLTIVGAIIGWLPIWMGILMNKAAGNVETGISTRDPRAVHTGMDNLRVLFKIQGIMMILGIIAMLLYMVLIIFVIAMGGMNL